MRGVKNLYLEKLRRMTDEQLVDECAKMGKIMEKREPMKKEDKIRAYVAFKYTAGRPGIDEDNKRILLMGMKVLRIL